MLLRFRLTMGTKGQSRGEGSGRRGVAILALGLLVGLAGCTRPPSGEQAGPLLPKPPSAEQPGQETPPAPAEASVVRIVTNKGDIVMELFDKQAPVTAGNFLLLVKSGFYDGLVFHRVVPDFVIQGGDPTGTGMGGPGFTIPDEISTELHHDRGIVSMAKLSPNTGGSQFFICLGGPAFVQNLDSRHAIFGKVTQGMDVADQIIPEDKMIKVTVERESPEAAAAMAAAKKARVPGK